MVSPPAEREACSSEGATGGTRQPPQSRARRRGRTGHSRRRTLSPGSRRPRRLPRRATPANGGPCRYFWCGRNLLHLRAVRQDHRLVGFQHQSVRLHRPGERLHGKPRPVRLPSPVLLPDPAALPNRGPNRVRRRRREPIRLRRQQPHELHRPSGLELEGGDGGCGGFGLRCAFRFIWEQPTRFATDALSCLVGAGDYVLAATLVEVAFPPSTAAAAVAGCAQAVYLNELLFYHS